MHNTADVHSLDFAAHCTPFHPATPPSSWAVVSQRFHSPLYLHPHQYFLQYLSNTLSGGGKQTHRYPFVDQSNASILWTAPRPPSRTFIAKYCLRIIQRIRRSVERARMVSSSICAYCKIDPPLLSSVTKNNQSVSSLILLSFAFAQCTRRCIYEPFLRAHQACAVLGVYAMWRYVKTKLVFPSLCIYISCGIFVVTALLELLWILYQYLTFHRDVSRANFDVIRDTT